MRQRRSGLFEKKIDIFILPGIEARFLTYPSRGVVTTLTELSLLPCAFCRLALPLFGA